MDKTEQLKEQIRENWIIPIGTNEDTIEEMISEYYEEKDPTLPLDALKAYLDNIGAFSGDCDLDSYRRDAEDAYQGVYFSVTEFAEELLMNTGDLDSIPENLRYYFDYQSYARDLFISDFVMLEEFVFNNY